MTDRPRTDLQAKNRSALAAFHAEVTRLMALSPESFAELHPAALAPLVATIRATPREMTTS
jgi:hypothetical protein